jgi:hypothetical protein
MEELKINGVLKGRNGIVGLKKIFIEKQADGQVWIEFASYRKDGKPAAFIRISEYDARGLAEAIIYEVDKEE